MAIRIHDLICVFFTVATSIFTAPASAIAINFAGDTASAAAGITMNGSTGHTVDSGKPDTLLVSAYAQYPTIDYKPKVFQRLWSEIRVPDARGSKRSAILLKNNANIFVKLADMYKETTAYALKQNRKLMIDVLTVEAAGGAKGFARSRKFAEYIFKSLKENGVENISLDPEPRDPIRLPPGLADQPPRGKT